MKRALYPIGLISLVLIVFLATGASSADLSVQWNETYDGPLNQSASAIIRVPGNSGYLFAGETGTPGMAGTDAWLVNLTDDGREVWNMTFGGTGDDTARAMINTSDGMIVFAGTFSYPADSSGTDIDAWVVKTDCSGTIVWNRTFGGSDVNASAAAVAEAEEDGYVVVGSIMPRNGGMFDAWVIRLNESGEEFWNRTFGTPGADDAADAVTMLPGGDMIFAGRTASAGAGKDDVWVVRVTGSGDEVWNLTFGGPDDDEARSVITTADGNLLVAGTFTERPDNETVDTDALLMKIDPSGTILWTWIYGDFGVNESANDVIETLDGGYLFAGETGYPETDDSDAWLVKTDAEGAVEWSKTFGGDNPGDRAAAVIQPDPDTYVFAGTLNATPAGGPIDLDAWVVSVGIAEAPEPTATPTAPATGTPGPTPTAGPTQAPVKPSKPPVEPKKPTVTVSPTTPAPTPTGDGTATPTPTPTGNGTTTATPTPAGTPIPDETTAIIGDRVWFDTNLNGIQDEGEPGVPDIPVILLYENYTAVQSTVTDEDGIYIFSGVLPGTYLLEFQPNETEYAITVRNNGDDAVDSDARWRLRASEVLTDPFSVDAGDIQDMWDAGLTSTDPADHPGAEPQTPVSGMVWYDVNTNGMREPGEPGMPAVGVRLIGLRMMVSYTSTDEQGFYRFGYYPDTSYSIEVVSPPGYAFTAQDQGNDSVDSDVSSTNSSIGMSPQLSDGPRPVVWDAGLTGAYRSDDLSAPQEGWILGRVWMDEDGDGRQNEISGECHDIEIRLLDASGMQIASTHPYLLNFSVSRYLFGPLDEGNYSVEFVLPQEAIDVGYGLTMQGQGSETEDSDPDPATGRTGALTINADIPIAQADAGVKYTPLPFEIPPGNGLIAGTVFEDTNDNGIMEEGEEPIPSVELMLVRSADGRVVNRTQSESSQDGAGEYSFGSLSPLTYAIVITLPEGYTYAGQNSSAISAWTDPIEIAEDEVTVDIGLVPERATDYASEIHGQVWIDDDGNGMQENEEWGEEGITVHLLDSDGVRLDTRATFGGHAERGGFVFDNLKPGDYSIEVELPAGYVFTEPFLAETKGSDVDPVSGRTGTISLQENGIAFIWVGLVPTTADKPEGAPENSISTEEEETPESADTPANEEAPADSAATEDKVTADTTFAPQEEAVEETAEAAEEDDPPEIDPPPEDADAGQEEV